MMAAENAQGNVVPLGVKHKGDFDWLARALEQNISRHPQGGVAVRLDANEARLLVEFIDRANARRTKKRRR